ncbi:unnamed protein product [Staurois parvus]|uniref:Uncharacterized protein n=1 Tax=Staurois parvus TaxID=386267 RepID=A0ABN9ASG1_9NEOB|nr:unnamed protein product [Staurois parvus]
MSITGSQPEIPCQHLAIGERAVCEQHGSFSCRQEHAALYFSAQHVSLVKHTRHMM